MNVIVAAADVPVFLFSENNVQCLNIHLISLQ